MTQPTHPAGAAGTAGARYRCCQECAQPPESRSAGLETVAGRTEVDTGSDEAHSGTEEAAA